MQSWGTQSRFSVRDAGLEPSKSGVIGLLCAALGKPRQETADQGDRLPLLSTLATLRMGVRVDRPGRVDCDYQTAGGSHRQGDRYGVAKANRAAPETVTSQRYYLADASFLVGLEGGDRPLLCHLHEAVARPVWPLYLGRKSYVPSRPVFVPDGVEDATLRDALVSYPIADELWRRGPDDAVRLVLEVAYGAAGGEVHTDVPLSFHDRTFADRTVRQESVPRSQFTRKGGGG